VATLLGHENTIRSIAFSPDGAWLASGSEDNAVRLWEVRTGKLTGTLEMERREEAFERGVTSVAFDPDGTRLAIGNRDGAARLWDLRTRQVLLAAEGIGPYEQVLSVAFSPDGARFAIGFRGIIYGIRGVIQMLDFGSGIPKPWELDVPDVRIDSLAFSPDGALLAAAGLEGTLQIWDVRKGKPVAVRREHDGPLNAVTFSPDGVLVAAAGEDGTARLWETRTGKTAGILEQKSALEPDPVRSRGRLNSLVFSERGSLLTAYHLWYRDVDNAGRSSQSQLPPW
jgi:WD40 repeat protein